MTTYLQAPLAQGYSVEQNIGFQDNISTMRLEVNGTMSSSKQTKHIKARYFFVKDKIEDGDLEVQYCPTEQMWTYVLNKPEQGTPFQKHRAALMNVPLVDGGGGVDWAEDEAATRR